MNKRLNPIERQNECREALRSAVRSVARRADADAHPNDWADMIAAHLEANGFRVHYKRILRNGRAPNGPPLTKEQARQARALRRQFPNMRISTIANRIGANSGRVSEALAGMR